MDKLKKNYLFTLESFTTYKKRKIMRFLFFLVFLSGICFASDNFRIEVYKLSNGLTVMLNEDKNASNIAGALIVKGGGKQDPANATGIAHYLEHMLFKGTDKLGTVNYEAENFIRQYRDIL